MKMLRTTLGDMWLILCRKAAFQMSLLPSFRTSSGLSVSKSARSSRVAHRWHLGMARKQIRTTGRPGRTRTYVGREAVAEGAFRVLRGVVFIAGACLKMMILREVQHNVRFQPEAGASMSGSSAISAR